MFIVYVYVCRHKYNFFFRIHSAQECRNRTVDKLACSKMGWTAARRNAPKQPRVIRAGPNEGKKIGAPIPVYPIFATYRGFIRFFWLTGGLSDFSRIPGIYRMFLTYRGFIGFPFKYRDFVGFLLNTEGLSDPRPKIRGFIEDRYIGSATKNPGVYL